MNTEWKLVPVEPTDEMEVAAENDYEQTGATFPRWKSAYAAMLAAAPPAPTSHPIPTGATGESIKLVHLAVAEDGGVRFMTGRKLPEGIESCELYAMPDYGRAPAELFRAPAAGDARVPTINIEAAAKALAECMDYSWAHMPEQGRATMREHAQTVIRAASQQQEG